LVVVSCCEVSRYEDGKMLKGTGTRASKSRLAALWAQQRRNSSLSRRIYPLCFFDEKEDEGEDEGRTKALNGLDVLLWKTWSWWETIDPKEKVAVRMCVKLMGEKEREEFAESRRNKD
jgi:hypothetical protein